MTPFLLESPDRHCQTKPATCTVSSRRHGHKASARANRAGRDITVQGGWRCACLHITDSVPALSSFRSPSVSSGISRGSSLACCLLPQPQHASLSPQQPSESFTPLAHRAFGGSIPAAAASLPPLLLVQSTLAELLHSPPAIRRAQWALHVTYAKLRTLDSAAAFSTTNRAFGGSTSIPAAELAPSVIAHGRGATYSLLIRRALWAPASDFTSTCSTRSHHTHSKFIPMRLCASTTPPSGAVKLGRLW